jgi:hypothetical protein
MKRRGLGTVVAAATGTVLLLLGTVPAASAATGPARAAAARQATPDCGPPPLLPRHSFPSRPHIDNRFLPLAPGTRWTLKGNVDGVPHTLVSTVTGLTKRIDGVTGVVVRDQDFGEKGRIQEDELAVFAQNWRGTVWGLAEYPEVYDHGKLVGAPDTWASGIDGTRAGIAMPAWPRTHTPPYDQGDAPSIDFRDCAQVLRTGQQLTVPAGSFDDVLVVDEWAPLDPSGGHQLKFYAPGVGLLRAAPEGQENNPEVLSLTSVQQLSPDELARTDREALAMDTRGRHRVSPDVWGLTPPAQ